MGYTPQYDYSSLGVLVGYVGGGDMTAGSANLTVAFIPLPGRPSAFQFTAGMVGSLVSVMGAGPGGSLLIARIASYVAYNRVVLDTAASVTVPGNISNTTVFRPVRVKVDTIQCRDSISDSSDAEFTVEVHPSEYPPSEGQPFLLTSTDTTVADAYGTFFGGEIDKVEVSNLELTGYSEARCACVSYKAVLQRRVVAGKVYSSTNLQTVAADVITRGTTYDYIDLTTVTGPSIALWTCDEKAYVADALDSLCQYVSDATHKYFWTINHWRRVLIANEGTTPAPFSVSDVAGTDGNATVAGTNTTSRDKLANQVYAKTSRGLGAPITESVTNPLHEGGPYTGFYDLRVLTLKNKAGITPSLTVDGSSKKVWVCPTDPRTDTTPVTIPSEFDWGWPENSDFLFTRAGSLGGPRGVPPGKTAVITYQVASETFSLQTNVDSVNERANVQGGSGLHEVVESIDLPVTKSELDAWTAARATSFGVVPKSVARRTYRGGLKAGQGLTVHFTDINAIGNYLIESVSLVSENGWVAWDFKASVGSIIGDWTTALVEALGGSAVGGGGGLASKDISGSLLTITATFADAVIGVAYSVTPTVDGGDSPYSFQQSGTLPSGLAFDSSNGKVSGTPTTLGTSTFRISILDSKGQSAYLDVTLNVVAPSTDPVPVLTLPTAPTDVVGSRWSDPAQHAVISLPYTLTNGPTKVAIWAGKQGTTPIWRGVWMLSDANPGTVLIGARNSNSEVYPPTASNETWVVVAAVGDYQGGDAVPAGAITSPAFTMSTPGVYGTTGSSSIGTPTMVDTGSSGGSKQYTVEFDLGLPLADKDFFFARISRLIGKKIAGVFTRMPGQLDLEGCIGTPIGDWALPTATRPGDIDHAEFLSLNQQVQAAGLTSIHCSWGPHNYPTGEWNVLRFYYYLGTRKDDGSGGTKTTQSTWPTGEDHYDLILDTTKALTDASLTTTSSWGSGVQGGSGTKPNVRYGGGVQDDGSGNVTLRLGSGIQLVLGAANIKLGNGMGFDVFSQIVPNLGAGLATSGSQIVAALGNGLMIQLGSIVPNLGSGLILSGSQMTARLGNGLTAASGPITPVLSPGSPITVSAGGFALTTSNGVKVAGAAVVIDLGAGLGGLTLSGTALVASAGTGISVGVQIGISNGGVGPTQISSVNFSQLNAGTMNVGGGGATFYGTGGIIIAGSGSISVLVGSVSSATGFNTGPGGVYQAFGSTVIDSFRNFVGAGVSVSGGCGALGFNPTGFTGMSGSIGIKDGFGNYCSLEINGVNYGPVRLRFVNGIYTGTI